jgi:hypothetical protein
MTYSEPNSRIGRKISAIQRSSTEAVKMVTSGIWNLLVRRRKLRRKDSGGRLRLQSLRRIKTLRTRSMSCTSAFSRLRNSVPRLVKVAFSLVCLSVEAPTQMAPVLIEVQGQW